MHILLTGTTGYIGRRLLPVLVTQGHKVTCLVRDARRFDLDSVDAAYQRHIHVREADLEDPASLEALPLDIDAAYYFVHGMASSYTQFSTLEDTMVRNFAAYLGRTQARQVIYLGGIANAQSAPEGKLSRHLESRRRTEELLRASGKPLTVLRAAIIIGSGSASFEIIRDLVEKLPVMVAPKWVKSRCQPIAIRNVIHYLTGVLLNEATFDRDFDIGGPDVLTYREMLLRFAEVRGLRRAIITVPVLTPKLSSYWLYFVTSTSYNLARSLVESMHLDVVCRDDAIQELVPQELFNYQESLRLAFQKIEQNEVLSSWTDTISGSLPEHFLDFVKVPTHGCLHDHRSYPFTRDPEEVAENIWSIGGKRGWYYGTWLWKIRGILDKMVGGVGLRRGRRNPRELRPGDALDFWRVILADRKNRRLLLYAEMRLPGEAWLEFAIRPAENGAPGHVLHQTATFRPHGLLGRLYWYAVLPFHLFVFPGLARRIIRYG